MLRHSLPTEVVESPFLETFMNRVDVVLRSTVSNIGGRWTVGLHHLRSLFQDDSVTLPVNPGTPEKLRGLEGVSQK